MDKLLVSKAIHRIRIILLELNADIDHDCSTFQGDGCNACYAVDNLGDMISAAVTETFKVESEREKEANKIFAKV